MSVCERAVPVPKLDIWSGLGQRE